jgi:hypothetical protein
LSLTNYGGKLLIAEMDGDGLHDVSRVFVLFALFAVLQHLPSIINE